MTSKEYREANKDKIKKWNKKYRETHKEEIDLLRKKNKERQKEYDIAKRAKSGYAESHSKCDKKYRANLKIKFLAMYGSKCNCPGCNETNPQFLTLDHINNDGYKARKNKNNTTEYINAIEEYRPDKYQVLCFNCNSGRGKNGGTCPHFGLNITDTAQARYWRKLKITFIELYGGKCTMCGESNIGFLTMDHVQNDGYIDRKTMTIKQRYLDAIRIKNTKKYAVLCWNCNCTKNIQGESL